MGKKSRVKTQKSGTGATATVSPKEILNLTSELLQSKFSTPSPHSPAVLATCDNAFYSSDCSRVMELSETRLFDLVLCPS